MNKYTATLTSDSGKHKLTVIARDKQSAINQIIMAENCPECAILNIIETPVFYKVIKIFRVSTRREVLERNLTEEEAKIVVNSYPDSPKSMVIYTRQTNYSNAKN